MGKMIHDDVLDAALQYIIDNCGEMTLCSQEPTTYTEGSATYALADVAMSSADFDTLVDGDVSGRKVPVKAQLLVEGDAAGTATHIALLDTSNSALLFVTTMTAQVIASGSFYTIAEWDIEFQDPN